MWLDQSQKKQRKETMKTTSFERRLDELRSSIDLLTEPVRSEFRTLVDEVQQQYKLWQGNDAKVRLFTDDLRLIAKSVAFELDVWQSDVGPRTPEEDCRGEPYRRLDSAATIEPYRRLLRRNLPEADASAENA